LVSLQELFPDVDVKAQKSLSSIRAQKTILSAPDIFPLSFEPDL
jgi:hypothetical protein